MKSPDFQLRLKIEAIISKSSPVPDTDCPDDPESVRFWCTCGGRSSSKETTKVSATAETTVAPSAEGLAQLISGGVELGGGTPPTSAVGNRPTIKALVDLANAEAPPATAGAPKAKAKGKAKAKVAPKKPQTPAEQRTSIRFPVESSKYFFVSMCHHTSSPASLSSRKFLPIRIAAQG